MPRLDISEFLGERPGVDPFRLPRGGATVARNVRLVSGSIEPFWGRAVTRATDSGVTPRTIFRDRNGTWLEFDERTHVVNSVVGDDAHDRIFYTGSSGARVSDGARRMTGAGPYPGASLALGLPPVAGTPTATITLAGDELDENGAPNLEQSRAYVVTFQNTFGEESVQSPASTVVRVYPNATVTLGLPAAPTGDYDFEFYNVYRITDGLPQYVGSVGIAATQFVDDVAGDLAQEGLPSGTYYPPPAALRSLIGVNGRFLAGISGNQVLLSEDQLPHAWPIAYRQPLDYDPVGLGTFEGMLVVPTKGPLFVAQGTSPDTMLLTETGFPHACVAEEGIVSMANGVVYPAADGLVFVGANGPMLVTATTFTPREWRALVKPSSIRATHWEGIYIASFDLGDGTVGAFMFDPMAPDVGVIWLDLPRTSALYNHFEEDRLYMVDVLTTQVKEWDADSGGTFANARWAGPLQDAPVPVIANVAKVRADGYPVTLRVQREGSTQATVSVPSAEIVRVPSAARGRYYTIEIETAHRVRHAAIATDVPELKEPP